MTDRIKGSNLPFINLSKENLKLIYDALEAEQAGKMIFALTEYVYDGIEPNFETKIEKSVWNNIMLLIDRKSEERQSDTQDVAKEEKQPQTTDLSEWVIATTNKIFDLEDQLQNIGKEVAIMQIEKTIADLGTDTKDALDFKEYITKRIIDSIKQKKYE